MSFNNKPLIILVLTFVSLFSCTPEKKPLTLATYTYHTNNRLENLKPLAELLQSKLDRPIHLKSYPDVASMLRGINSDSVDIGLINTLGYLKLSLDNRNMEVIAALRTKVEARDNYKTVILTNRTDITSLDDLASKAKELRMMFVNEGSTSGNLVPRLLLNSIGIQSPNTQFKNVSYGGNHTDTWKSLLEGQVDICSLGSNEYYTQMERNPATFESLTALWISNEIPLGPVLLNNDLTPETVNLITEILLELHNESPNALESLKSGWSEALQAEKFYRINMDDYDSINTAFRENKELQLMFNQ